MHVTPSELRVLKQDGIVLRFALLDSMAFVLAEIPEQGSAGSALEQPCVNAHWGFVISGELAIELGGQRRIVPAGSAFHVPPSGPPHRLVVAGSARIAGFEPVEAVHETSDASLVARGFEVLGPESIDAATVIPAEVTPLLEPNRIDARTWSMSSLVLTQACFGPGSGYTTAWCDAPHWGLVTSGRLALEWEDDIEILSAGEVYHCPGGPPGHRLEAADPAAIIDLTPVHAFAAGRRIAPWRQTPASLPDSARPGEQISVAPLG